jgi:CheY-like chemotaxis protein
LNLSGLVVAYPEARMANYIPIDILVADDSFDDVLFLSLAFRKARINHSLTRVANGKEAIEYLRDNSPPDVLLLDLKMPGMDGFEVLKWIREQPALANLPVIVVSGSNLQSDKARAKELGARDYFVKDADWEPLVNGLSLRIAELTSEVA